MQQYLEDNASFDFKQPEVVAFGKSIVEDETNPIEIAKRLYNGVRDHIRYNAYTFETHPASFSASYCLNQGESYCVPKAVLLGALCRLYGIPARLGLADVRNHIASPQFLEYLQSDVFVMHGYTDIYLNDQWVKATPAFDKHLCKVMNVEPLEFNGLEDSIFHAFDKSGAKHMEYLADHGTYADVPVDFILQSVAEAYPHLANKETSKSTGRSFEQDMQNLDA